ncbi:7093_t:CDS:2 [Paraglomus occultum]|uniref:7093_t:CDS:1 n=1 Tax=Paraglomus occultum TaxID=144539 RepID=A0A9N9G127_9GLOM|nr:7093_t:CDS:2 [Paraglomus occultum]
MPSLLELLALENLWFLLCLLAFDPTDIPGFPVDACSVILSSTPQNDFISAFSKLVPAPPVFYMPLWTREELEVVVPLHPDAADIWMEHFELLACKQCDLEDCIKLVSVHSEITPKTKIIQTLIHLKSNPPHEEASVVYASETAMKIIACTKWTDEHLKMQNLLGSCSGNPLAAALCGYIFEPYAIDLLKQGGTFQCQELVSGNKRLKQDSFDLNVSKSVHPRQVVDCVEEGPNG